MTNNTIKIMVLTILLCSGNAHALLKGVCWEQTGKLLGKGETPLAIDHKAWESSKAHAFCWKLRAGVSAKKENKLHSAMRAYEQAESIASSIEDEAIQKAALHEARIAQAWVLLDLDKVSDAMNIIAGLQRQGTLFPLSHAMLFYAVNHCRQAVKTFSSIKSLGKLKSKKLQHYLENEQNCLAFNSVKNDFYAGYGLPSYYVDIEGPTFRRIKYAASPTMVTIFPHILFDYGKATLNLELGHNKQQLREAKRMLCKFGHEFTTPFSIRAYSDFYCGENIPWDRPDCIVANRKESELRAQTIYNHLRNHQCPSAKFELNWEGRGTDDWVVDVRNQKVLVNRRAVIVPPNGEDLLNQCNSWRMWLRNDRGEIMIPADKRVHTAGKNPLFQLEYIEEDSKHSHYYAFAVVGNKYSVLNWLLAEGGIFSNRIKDLPIKTLPARNPKNDRVAWYIPDFTSTQRDKHIVVFSTNKPIESLVQLQIHAKANHTETGDVYQDIDASMAGGVLKEAIAGVQTMRHQALIYSSEESINQSSATHFQEHKKSVHIAAAEILLKSAGLSKNVERCVFSIGKEEKFAFAM